MIACRNCKNRKWRTFGGYDYCIGYEMSDSENNNALDCDRYEEEVLDEDEEHYCPSATMGDYSPSNPWDAPGMSIRDFI